MEQIQKTLKEVFGFNTFRPNQETIIRQILRGRDVFVVMPTGGGKSLCYQLPAKLMQGTAIVISPLISLMKDQVDGALENNIAAAFLNSSLSAYERADVRYRLCNNALDILYIAPERLANPGFLETIRSLPITLFAIDEAHCISEWGHDFRPDYLNLSCLKDIFPGIPVAAFTATATNRVQEDIIKKMDLDNPFVLRASFDRANLYYHIKRKRDVKTQVLEYILQHRDEPGIIYRTTRSSVVSLVDFLKANRIPALAYHAGMEADQRRRNQEAFNRDEVIVIVATIAFGMGIDKSNVRYVIHADLPKNIESYYQETGRAGRDGEKAECLLFFSNGDIPKLRYFINKIEDEQERHIAVTKLSQMVKYASHNRCRRRTLLEYFSEKYPAPACSFCDICNGEHEQVDISTDARILMSAVMRTGQRFGIRHIIDIVSGANTKRIRQYNHDNIKTYGAGKDKPKKHWSFIVDELLSQEVIILEGDQYPVVRITAAGNRILFGKEKIFALVQPEQITAGQGGMKAVEFSFDESLFEKLRTLRREIARKHKVPPYIIFSDKTLREMAARFPSNAAEMSRISGVGETKLKNYGDIFLGEIAAYLEANPGAVVCEQQFSYRADEAGKPAKKQKKGETYRETYRLLKQGFSVEEVAGKRKLALSTITGHIEKLLQTGFDLEITDYISRERCSEIEQVFVQLQTWQLTAVINFLGGRATFDEVKIVRGYLQGRRQVPGDANLPVSTADQGAD